LQIRHDVLSNSLSIVFDFITAARGFQCDQALILAPDNARISAAQPLAGMTQSFSGSKLPRNLKSRF
jgi:hypothetical protein